MQKILAIDDMKEYLVLLSALLKQLFPGIAVLTALSGEEGIGIAREEQPDVILLDVVMPGIDGFETCTRLKKEQDTLHIPVIMVTGIKIEADDRILAIDSGADAFLLKPVNEVELLTQVKAMLRIKAAEDRLRDEKNTYKNMMVVSSRELRDEREQRRKSAEMLRLYADIVDTMQVGLHLYHLEDLENDHTLRMIYVNRSGAKILGLTEDDLVGKTLDENFPGLREKGVPQNYAEVIRTGKPIKFEDIVYGDERILMAHFLVHAFPLPGSCIGVLFEDISPRRRAEIALQESEEKFRLLFEHMMDAFALHKMVFDGDGNPVDYRFLEMNRAFEEHTGLKKSDVIGKTVKEIMPNTDTFWFKKYGEVVKTGKPIRFDHFSTPLDSYFEVSAFCPKEGEFATVFKNITIQKRAERKIKKSLKEKELLLRDIHHRIKNNLTTVSSLLNIQSNYMQDEAAKSAFKQSRKRIQSIALLHEKLYRSVDLAHVEFGEYIGELADALIISAAIPQESIDLTVDIRDIYFIVDTAIPLGLIVTELVTNALKYGFKEREKLRILIRLEPGGNDDKNYHLTVSDSGPGIPGDMDWKHTETLGIQLVIMLTEQLEGEVQLERNKGTTFHVTFPVPVTQRNN